MGPVPHNREIPINTSAQAQKEKQMARRPNTEAAIQKALVAWAKSPEMQAQFPALALLHSIPNEHKTYWQMGKELKAMGACQ
jgi:hypothetical protein